MRYQKLEIQEATWKWQYLVKKYYAGINVTKHLEQSLVEQTMQHLFSIKDEPKEIEAWIKREMLKTERTRLRQAVRAKRKRFFNAESPFTRKKSIDLEFSSWERLANLSHTYNFTLSATVHFLIDEFENKKIYLEQLQKIKDLSQTQS